MGVSAVLQFVLVKKETQRCPDDSLLSLLHATSGAAACVRVGRALNGIVPVLCLLFQQNSGGGAYL